MKSKVMSFLTSLPVFVCSVVLSMFIFTQTGCNSSGDTKYTTAGTTSLAPVDSITDWLTLNIRFKASVSKEIREFCIKTVEKYIIDTLTIIRGNGYPAYKPSVSIKSYPFGDSVSYQFKVSKPSELPFALAKDTAVGPDVTCKCPNCGICQRVKGFSIMTGSQTYPTLLADLTEFINTP